MYSMLYPYFPIFRLHNRVTLPICLIIYLYVCNQRVIYLI